MSKKALTLIQRCMIQKLPHLDIGKCELIDFDFIEGNYISNCLTECTHLHTLILSNYWWDYQMSNNNWKNYENSKITKSKNNLAPNKFRIIPPVVGKLKNLSILICSGKGYPEWEITDISTTTQLTNLNCLDLSYNKIDNLTGIEKLTKLKKIDLRSNRIKDIKPLVSFLKQRNEPFKIVFEPNAPIGDYEINLNDNPLNDALSDAISQGNESILRFYGESVNDNASMKKIIKVFLASSKDLSEERKEFETFLYRESAMLFEEKNIFIKLEIWENFFDAISTTRKQDDYNKKIEECDIFVIMYSKKVGKYSNEEFEKAYNLFKKVGRPLIYTYFKNETIDINDWKREDYESLQQFQDNLNNIEHFPVIVKDSTAIKLHFKNQLDNHLVKILTN